MTRASITLTAAASLALLLCGCNKAQSPADVRHDVAKATDSAAQADAKAADRLAKADEQASEDVAKAEARADRRTTDAAGDAVITQAEGDHKVAVAQCESLSGQAQKDCRQQADQQLDNVKARVKQLKSDARDDRESSDRLPAEPPPTRQ